MSAEPLASHFESFEKVTDVAVIDASSQGVLQAHTTLQLVPLNGIETDLCVLGATSKEHADAAEEGPLDDRIDALAGCKLEREATPSCRSCVATQ